MRNWKRLQFPKVTVQYGMPFRYERVDDPTRDQQQAVADGIFHTIRELYAELNGSIERVGRGRALAEARTA